MATGTAPVAKLARAAKAPSAPDPLKRYRDKRDFAQTPEPAGTRSPSTGALSFVVQKHAATRLHYDFRLELDGVLLSWAVPKGPSYDPADKRMAVRTEDHPLSYGGFEGTIPPGQYGAGDVIVWDSGRWEPLGDPHEGLEKGKLGFRLDGHKLKGAWELVRLRPADGAKETWILFKKRDALARPHGEYDVVAALPDSVLSAPPAKPRRARADVASSGNARRIALPEGAREAPLPARLAPQLATLAADVPSGGDWICELKFDGYRVLARYEHGTPRLFTRNGHDWTSRMPALAKALERLAIPSGWLDGEVVVLKADGAPDFNALQNAFDRSDTNALTYFAFDLPFYDGHDLRDVPLAARRALLEQLMRSSGSEQVRFSADFGSDARRVLDSACRMKLEGVIAKRAQAPYRSERNASWLKLKCQQRQEFVVGGWVDRANAVEEVGSLLLGVYDANGALQPVGGVGTGWDAATAHQLHRRLRALEVTATPFALPAGARRLPGSRRAAAGAHWVEPRMVVEVAFGEWTPGGQIRHAVFAGVRDDKPAAEITREAAVVPASAAGNDARPDPVRRSPDRRAPAASPRARGARPSRVGGIAISNPQRVIDPSSGLTKLDLVHYYDSVADWILPHLRGRAVSLVRGPSGIGGPLFFQKHGDKIAIPGLKALDPALWPGHDALLEIDSRAALVGAAQFNAIELHTWNSKVRAIDHPDRIVFDLDPGEGLAWAAMQEGALLVRTLLAELGLKSWLKTSGGKGLHVVVPVAPREPVDVVRALSQAIVVHLAQTIPARFVAKSGAVNRVGKIFVDYLRNGLGATTVAAFSARARPGMGVSMPVAWEEIGELKGGAHWTVATARDHLSLRRDDPWADYARCRQTLRQAARRLGFDPAKAPAA